MPTKPSTLPVWATDPGATVTPSGGEQAAGWVVDQRPPARKMNWWQNLVYQFIQYLDAPVGTGAGAAISGTGGATSGSGLKGTGGAPNGAGLEGQGTGTGAGVKGTGGATNAKGVTGQGTGSGAGVAGTGGATAAGVTGTGGATSGDGVTGTATAGNSNGGTFTGQGSGKGAAATGGATGIGVQGVGGATSGGGVLGLGSAGDSTGVEGSGGATNGVGVKGNGTGTGDGVYGIGVNGYGVRAESDTTSPAKAALRIVPQDADPSSSPAAGDAYVHTTSGKITAYDGTTWQRYVPQSFAMIADVVSGATTGSRSLATYTIPANRLRAGSTIRVRTALRCTAFAGAATVTVSTSIGGTIFQQSVDVNASSGLQYIIDATITMQSIGASGAYRASSATIQGNNSVADTATVYRATGTIDTTASIVIDARLSLISASDQVTLEQFIVDVT